MAGKKIAAPEYVYVILGTATYDMNSTIHGVYASQGAALEAAGGNLSLVNSVAVNYNGAEAATAGNAEGETAAKAKPKTKAPKAEKDTNGESATKAISKKKSIPEGEPHSLAGRTLASSGTLRTLDRLTFEQTVEKYGGTFNGGKFTASTTVVLGDKPGPKKLEEISENHSTTMSEEDFYETIGADFAPPAKKAKKE